MGIWDKLKKAFGGGAASPPPPEPPDPPDEPAATKAATRKRSNRVWTLTKRGNTLALIAPHGTFEVGGIEDQAGFSNLSEGDEILCEGDYVGGSSITELVVTKIGVEAQGRSRTQSIPPPSASAQTSAQGPYRTAWSPPEQQVQLGTDKERWRANEILGLSQAELRKRALKIRPWATAWIGRVDTIPPQTDERTAIIDRGVILRGLLTKEQIDEIHRIGDQWILHHDALKVVEAAAKETADQAVEAERQRKAAIKAAKKQEAAAREVARQAAVAERRATDIIYAGRGVSARLHDRRANVEELMKLGLPVLASPADVARSLGLAITHLRWLCFHAEAATKTHYVYFEVPKRSGGTRLLSSPHKHLAKAQRWILQNILSKLELTPHAHGFVADRSTVTNARPHIGKDLVINLDLEAFFPTITFPRVRGLFESLGYSPAAATLLALLVTESPRVKVLHDGNPYWVATGDRALPQGACTSPVISNLVARKLDRRLAGACVKLGWTYTRYADDLTFSASGEATKQMSLVMSRVRAIVRDEGFAINEAKGRVSRAARRQQVTGIVVNDKLGVPREEMRRIRAILHGAKTTGLAAQNRDNRPDFEAWLRGKIAYIAMVDRERGPKLLAALDALPR
jgi:RNA-directed DNA polymerase